MAVRNISEAKPKKKKFHKVNVLLALFFIFTSVIAFSVFYTNIQKANDFEEEYNELLLKTQQLKADSLEIEEILKDDDHYEYFEKIARENYGYCKPGEKVYYNSSFGE